MNIISNLFSIESYDWNTRRKVVKAVDVSLHLVISAFNFMTRWTNAIMKGSSFFVFLSVHTLIPAICFVTCLYLLARFGDKSGDTMLNDSMIAAGVSLVMVVLVQSVVLNLELAIIRVIRSSFAKCMKQARVLIVEAYRHTGWTVLDLMVKKDQQTMRTIHKVAIDLNLPREIAALVCDFTVCKELGLYLEAKHSPQKTEKLAMTMKPCQILESYLKN